MWWYRRGNSGGSWLPEEKKANMWYGRGNSGGSWLPAFPPSPGGLKILPCINQIIPYCMMMAIVQCTVIIVNFSLDQSRFRHNLPSNG